MKKRIWYGVAVVILGGIAWLTWLSQTGWIDDYNREHNATYEALKTEGETFGRSADQMACLDQALSKVNGCLNFHCKVGAGKYLKACWTEAADSDALCTNMPEFNEKPSEDEKAWAKDHCGEANIIGDGCPLIMRQTQLFCASKGSL